MVVIRSGVRPCILIDSKMRERIMCDGILSDKKIRERIMLDGILRDKTIQDV